MKITKRQLRRIIRESIYSNSQPLKKSIRSIGSIDALAAAQEMGYRIDQPPELDSNNRAIDDALAAYPGEFTYEDIIFAVDAAGGVI